MTSILIGGDIYPVGRLEDAFAKGNADKIFHDLLEDITGADLSIVNLECPLVSEQTPIEKPGGVLSAHSKLINGFIAAGWDVLNLANNHSFDQGTTGLKKTIQTIKKAGLDHVGAGMNIEEAARPLIRDINGERIVTYSMAEREFSIADRSTAGANPLDLINAVNKIKKYKQHGIFILLIHGGKEFYPYPSPEMVRRCRFMVDMGADAVVCCHTHCPLPWEIYAGRPIVYGLGNLIFEPINDALPSWREGYLAKLTVNNKEIRFEAIPYFQSKGIPGARKMDDASEKDFFRNMEKKSGQLKCEEFLRDQWATYCHQNREAYLGMLFGYNKPMRRLQRLLLPLLHSREEMLRALVLVQCETHREILNTIFAIEKRNDKKCKSELEVYEKER